MKILNSDKVVSFLLLVVDDMYSHRPESQSQDCLSQSDGEHIEEPLQARVCEHAIWIQSL